MIVGSLSPDHKQQMRRSLATAGQLLIISQRHNAQALQEAALMKSSTSGAVSKFCGLVHSVMLLVHFLAFFGCPTPTNGGGVLT
jgi:hypothetical protein